MEKNWNKLQDIYQEKSKCNDEVIAKIETVFYVLKNFSKPFRKEDGTIIDSIVLNMTLLREILIKITDESYVNSIKFLNHLKIIRIMIK